MRALSILDVLFKPQLFCHSFHIKFYFLSFPFYSLVVSVAFIRATKLLFECIYLLIPIQWLLRVFEWLIRNQLYTRVKSIVKNIYRMNAGIQSSCTYCWTITKMVLLEVNTNDILFLSHKMGRFNTVELTPPSHHAVSLCVHSP